MTKNKWNQIIWDACCLLSVVGIWPRYIEPQLISRTKIICPVRNLPDDLEGFRIVQFSDLHLNKSMSDRFLSRLTEKILSLKPDLITFTGDFICYSKLNDPDRLWSFLCGLSAPSGCFAVLGNHDYARPVLINTKTGDYDAIERREGNVAAGLKLLTDKPAISGKVSEAAKKVDFNRPLMELLDKTPFRLLHNQTAKVSVKNSRINIAGLGEYMLGRALPEQAFEGMDKECPTIVLAHNPDSLPLLEGRPGDLVLCGHTHGAQINLPGLWKRFTLMENPKYKRGLFREDKKTIYVNRGIGSVFKFRLHSIPEITMFQLTKELI
jgi:uncharacterized protein